MVSITFTVDPDVLEAARLEAERCQTSLDQMFAEYVASVAQKSGRDETNMNAKREENRQKLLELMNEGVLGDLGKLPTREEIHAERTKWTRS